MQVDFMGILFLLDYMAQINSYISIYKIIFVFV